MNKVCVVGLWHLGLVSAASLADLGFSVTGYDSQPGLIQDLKNGKLPLFEPGLEDLVRQKMAAKHLSFESEIKKAISGAQFVLLTYDTPVNQEDYVDLSVLEQALEAMIPFVEPGALLMINSQIPVGTSEKWQKRIEQFRPGANIEVVYSPENLRLGNAIELYKNPDMIVIGSQTSSARKKAEEFFKSFSAEKFFVNWQTAEMAKHALNVFFAASISFANEIGNLCDAIGADGMEIAQILKKDSRIGRKAQVRPGLGFAGATLARDLRALEQLGKKVKVPTSLSTTVYEINQKQTQRLVEKIEAWFQGKLQGKTIGILGLTYKPGTSTLRRSSSLEIMDILHARGAKLRTHDPKADLKEYSGENYFQHFSDPYETVRGAEGVLLLTEWPEYRDLDYAKIKSLMGSSKMFLDAKNHLDSQKMKSLGFDYIEIGRGQWKTVVKSC